MKLTMRELPWDLAEFNDDRRSGKEVHVVVPRNILFLYNLQNYTIAHSIAAVTLQKQIREACTNIFEKKRLCYVMKIRFFKYNILCGFFLRNRRRLLWSRKIWCFNVSISFVFPLFYEAWNIIIHSYYRIFPWFTSSLSYSPAPSTYRIARGHSRATGFRFHRTLRITREYFSANANVKSLHSSNFRSYDHDFPRLR